MPFTSLFIAVRLVSSANSKSCRDLQENGKSSIYIRNNRGPRIDPCGTVQFILCQEEDILLTSTLWIRFEM